MGKVKSGAFTALGWTVWKVGSKLGWQYAKNKLKEQRESPQR